MPTNNVHAFPSAPSVLADAADWILALDALTTRGVPSQADRDTLDEQIDKAERRGRMAPRVAQILREVYGLAPVA